MKQSLLGYSIKREIQITTAAITGRRLRISYSGDGAWTTRTEMRLPTIHDAQLYPLDEVLVLRGYADHEADHHRYTPFDVIDALQAQTLGISLSDKEAAAKLDRRTRVRNVTAFNIWNAAEDWRIERNGMRDLPGTRKNLDATRAHVLRRERGIFDDDIARMDDPYAMASAAFTWLNACENGYTSGAIASRLLSILEAQNPFVHELATTRWPTILAAGALDDAGANREIYRVALEVCDAIMDRYPPDDQEPHKPEPQPPGPGGASCPGTPANSGSGSAEDAPENEQSAPGASGDAGDGSGPANPSGQGSDVTADAAEGNSRNASDDAREQAIQAAARAHEPEAKCQLDISDVAEAIAKITQNMPDGGASASSYPLADEVVRHAHTPGKAGLEQYLSVKGEITGVATTLSGAMRALVIARDNRKFRPNREDGDLDMGNIAGLALGARDIYEQTRISRANNTSIDFLLDISYSMKAVVKRQDDDAQASTRQKKHRRIDLLMQSLIALTEALGPARNVRTRYLGFTGGMESVDLHLIKNYQQGLQDTKHSIDLMIDNLNRNLIDMGGTPTGQAMLDAWSVQRERRDDKKIQIILTDGEPDHENIALAEQAAQAIKADGGHAIGIAIGGREPQFRMEKWVLVPDIESLPTAILGSLKTLLR